MWFLRNESKGLIFRVQPGKPNVVSRKDGDLLLVGDQSISRKHAVISVYNENINSGLVLKDLGSKYGTFTAIGGGELTQVSQNQPITLKSGDAIRFGTQWNIWRVEFFPLVVATSTLNVGEKAEVKEAVASLGGEVVNDWQPSASHLTMNKLTVTVKVVCALAHGKPIVVPGYWKALKDALVPLETKLPDCEEFLPPLAEALLNPTEVSFTPNPERKKLFNNYTFVASSVKQLARIKPMVTAAGGNAVQFSSSQWPHDKLILEQTIMMQHNPGDKPGSQQSQLCEGYISAARNLKAAGVRCIPESEIGLSILYCSMAQYCNPRSSQQSLFNTSGTSTQQNTQHVTVICPNTEESASPQSSGVASTSTRSKKRPLEESSKEEQNPSKKLNSEDMFSSQQVEVEESISNSPSTSSKKPSQKQKQIIDPSLDMFAPSDLSNQSKATLNQSPGASSDKAKQSVINPSLDMFAPTASGQSTTRQDQCKTNQSCQDMFATNQSRQTQEKKRTDRNESSSDTNKPPKISRIDEVNDEFSFTANKKTSEPQKTVKKDEFTFSSTRRSTRQSPIDQDGGDEFSFGSTKKVNHHNVIQEDNDEFSFVSSKSSKKRSRQSNPDMSDEEESVASCSKASTAKVAHNDIHENGDEFAFTKGPATKKKKDNERGLNLDKSNEEIKIGLFSKVEKQSLGRQGASEPPVLDDPPDNKHLAWFSKDRPGPAKIKEEPKDEEEVDELAKELQNTTIVVVKSLVVVREKPAEVQQTSSCKNFKKFRKVTSLNKSTVRRIIGGSDLVPHHACSNMDDVIPPPPTVVTTPDDYWGFPNDKKKGKHR